MVPINGGGSAFEDGRPHSEPLATDSVSERLGLRRSVLSMQAELAALSPDDPELESKRRALQQAYTVLGFAEMGE
jgi:hypothetical protein